MKFSQSQDGSGGDRRVTNPTFTHNQCYINLKRAIRFKKQYLTRFFPAVIESNEQVFLLPFRSPRRF